MKRVMLPASAVIMRSRSEKAHERYARGTQPERLRPTVARLLSRNRTVPVEKMARSYSQAAR